jgi:hypothetical protein
LWSFHYVGKLGYVMPFCKQAEKYPHLAVPAAPADCGAFIMSETIICKAGMMGVCVFLP